MEPKKSTKEEKQSTVAINSRRRGGRWRNGGLVHYVTLSLAKDSLGDISLRLANKTLPKLNKF